jgi:hypothetical protein
LQDISPSQLKKLNRRDQGPMHIIVMGSDGQTRRLSISGGTLRIVLVFMLITLAALAFAVHLYVGARVENQRLAADFESGSRLSQIKEYTKTVEMAPEEARRILELLDRAILMADNSEAENSLVGVPDETPDSHDDPPEPPPAEEVPSEAALPPLDALWQSFHSSLSAVPAISTDILDTEEFQIATDGTVSFVLKQNGPSGQRARGRAVTFVAVSDKAGRLSLLTAPEIDLADPDASAWELGSKYNIIASKVVRGKIEVPEGGKVLNAEVLAWDEDSKELVFRKKIKIEGR